MSTIFEKSVMGSKRVSEVAIGADAIGRRVL